MAAETKERDLHPKNPSLGKGVQIFGKNILIESEDAEMLKDKEEVRNNTRLDCGFLYLVDNWLDYVHGNFR